MRSYWILLIAITCFTASGCVSEKRPYEKITYRKLIAKNPDLQKIIIPAPLYWEEEQRLKQEMAASGQKFDAEIFKIQPGTRLTIEVPGESEYNKTVTVNPDGEFDYYHDIVSVHAAGMSIAELRAYLQEQLKKYLREPHVLINLNEVVNSSDVSRSFTGEIAIVGEINKTTSTVRYDGSLTVFDAIHAAGGLTNDSEWKDVAIIRRDPEKPHGTIIVCDAERFYNYADSRQDIKLRPRDIIFIPRNLTVYEHFERDFDTLVKLLDNITSVNDFDNLIELEIFDDRNDDRGNVENTTSNQ